MDDIRIGSDPEEAHLQVEDRMLQDVGWHPLASMQSDTMVSRVLAILRWEES